MITIEIDVLPGDVSEQIKWKEKRPNFFAPTSLLIDKFRDTFLAATEEKQLALTKNTKIEFFRSAGNLWSEESYDVLTNELAISERWVVIDRAIRIGMRHYKDYPPLCVGDIVKVKAYIPEEGDIEY